MIVWTVANQKGGVGKTTSTIALGGLMADRGHSVLLIDLDPHASLTYYLGFDADEDVPGSYDLFLYGRKQQASLVKDTIQQTDVDGLDLMAGSMPLATLDRRLGQQDGMGLILKAALTCIESDYDLVLIDCPPVLGVLMVNALACCQRILMPVQTEFLALKGLERMIKTLQLIRQGHRPLSPMVVPTMYDRRTKVAGQALQELKNRYGDMVWRGVIPVDTRFRDASLAHQTPSEFAPQARGVEAYRQLLDTLLNAELKKGVA